LILPPSTGDLVFVNEEQKLNYETLSVRKTNEQKFWHVDCLRALGMLDDVVALLSNWAGWSIWKWVVCHLTKWYLNFLALCILIGLGHIGVNRSSFHFKCLTLTIKWVWASSMGYFVFIRIHLGKFQVGGDPTLLNWASHAPNANCIPTGLGNLESTTLGKPRPLTNVMLIPTTYNI